MSKIRVLVADDYEIVRLGLSSILEQQSDVTVVGQAKHCAEAVQLAAQLSPDVVILGVNPPSVNGIEATRGLTAASSARVIALMVQYEDGNIAEMLRAGAVGCLVKSSAADELTAAVRTVHSGETYLSSKVAKVVVSTFLSGQAEPAKSAFSALSAKQRGVLQLLAEGKSNKEVAAALDISPKTVETHRAQIMEKLQIRTIAGLTKYAIREGLTSVDA